jgi:hypothetical protein
VRRLLARRSVVALVVVLVPLAAGIVYAVLTGRSSSGLEENKRALATAGAYPGAHEVGRGSMAMFPENALPVPRGLVTTVAYEPPAGTTQAEVVDFYLTRLRDRWMPKVERSLLGTTGERSFRVTFTEDERCLVLLTAGLLVRAGEQRVFTLSAYEANGEDC